MSQRNKPPLAAAWGTAGPTSAASLAGLQAAQVCAWGCPSWGPGAGAPWGTVNLSAPAAGGAQRHFWSWEGLLAGIKASKEEIG